MTGGSLERMVHGMVEATARALDADEIARRRGLLQGVDPRVKLIGTAALVVAAVAAGSLGVVAALLGVATLLAGCSRVPIALLAARVWAPVLLFSGAIALPAPFVVPGRPLAEFSPLGLSISAPGAWSAAMVVLRALTAATLGLLLVATTPWTHVLKALRVLRVPVAAVVLLGMTHRYVFLLLQSAHEMFESRRSRLVGRLSRAERRRMATASAGVLLQRSLRLADDVHLAMRARGYRGEVRLLDELRLRGRDWAALAVVLAVALVAGVAGHPEW